MSRSRAAKASSAVTLAVTGDLTIAEAAAQRDVLAALLTDGADHDVDLSAVDELDTAGLQLLVALTREIDRRGRLGSVVCSPSVTQVLTAAGLGADLRPLVSMEVPT